MNIMKKIGITLACVALTAALAQAIVLDWEKIVYWTGSGPNKAALVVQFADKGPNEAYVWGFRWEDGQFPAGAPTGEDMARAIAANSPDLILFTQYTGSLGSTVCGFGYYNPDGFPLSESLSYDFEGASNDKRVSFNYFTPNELMHQTSAPGNDTPNLCADAIAVSADSHIIEHPINYKVYGYPAYDYDWWKSSADYVTSGQRWNAGWYDGYWSYWTGGADFDELGYSGLGMTSRILSDGQVDAWKFTPLTKTSSSQLRHSVQNVRRADIDAYTGATEGWYDLNYKHFKNLTSAKEIAAEETGSVSVYDINGTLMATLGSSNKLSTALSGLKAGLYVAVSGKRVIKILIR